MDDEPLFDGWLWAILATAVRLGIVILIVWFMWAMLPDDDPPGRCRTELGYMGQSEVTECEPDE